MTNQPPAAAGVSTALPFPVLAAVLGLLSMFGAISIDMYLPALPAMETALKADPTAIQLTLGAFLAGFGLAQLVYGPVSDTLGRRPITIGGILLYIVGSVLCATAATVETLILARLLQGIGASAGPVMARAMVRDLYGRDQSARMYSLLMLLMGAAPMAAPVIGGQLLTVFDWRSIFWTLTGFGALCLIVALVLAPETLAPARRSRGSLNIALHHYRDLIRSRAFLGYSLSQGCVFAAMFAYIAGSPHVYITVMGLSPQTFSFVFAGNVVGMMILSAVNGRIVTRVGADRMLSYGLALTLFGACLLLATASFGLFGIAGIAAPLFLMLASLGMVGANSLAGALAAYPHMAGAAAALSGVLPFVLGTGAGALLGLFHDPSARPMAYVMFALVLTGFLIHRVLIVGAPPRAAA